LRRVFFSSSRRHTRFSRDWSSDVCSSDLLHTQAPICIPVGSLCGTYAPLASRHFVPGRRFVRRSGNLVLALHRQAGHVLFLEARSEERRVGKESSSRRCSSRWTNSEP